MSDNKSIGARFTRLSFAMKVILFLTVFAVATALFYWVVRSDWTESPVESQPVSRYMLSGELNGENTLVQTFRAEMDSIRQLALDTAVLSEDGNSLLILELYDGEKLLSRQEYPVAQLQHDGYNVFFFSHITDVQDKLLRLEMKAEKGGIAFWYGNSRSAGKFDVAASASGTLTLGGQPMEGELVMKQIGVNEINMASWIWPGAALLAILLLAVAFRIHLARKHGRSNVFVSFYDNLKKYRFLLKQLVNRDFKVRYKASVLGVLWSFLNPLMMTMVYNVVFSTIFRSNIEYFIVYLMSGIILFNYFSEATNLGMQSIVGNAGLITKVYIPKYIFPVSKTISSAINMVISLLPLLILMVITGVPLHKSLFLLPLVIIFMLGLTTGLGLILSSLMVRFHDIQFIWSIFLTIMNFLTPIFYPESIIPASLIKLYHLNPLYQILYFTRTITIGGVSPTPITYLYCTLSAAVPMAIGIYAFRKSQDSFALYL